MTPVKIKKKLYSFSYFKPCEQIKEQIPRKKSNKLEWSKSNMMIQSCKKLTLKVKKMYNILIKKTSLNGLNLTKWLNPVKSSLWYFINVSVLTSIQSNTSSFLALSFNIRVLSSSSIIAECWLLAPEISEGQLACSLFFTDIMWNKVNKTSTKEKGTYEHIPQRLAPQDGR